jgi:hypothetical protein
MCALCSSDRTHYGHGLWQEREFQQKTFPNKQNQLIANTNQLAAQVNLVAEKARQAFAKETELRTKSREQANAGATT